MIPVLFNILLFTIPLIFYKGTSELFEFNKIVALYGITTIIASIWIINSIRAKKIIFRQTLLDLPLLGYLVTLLLSALFSIDPRTSFLGYYSRFNGGLISQLCYAILYWAFVSNMNAKQAKQSLVFSLWSLAIASALAILEHFGVFTTCGLMGLGYKESCWVQDVQSRVFSTLGQPNWLAALLVAMLPISNFQFLISNKFSISKIFWFLLSILFFVTLLFTGSRSGFLAFGVESIIFWGFIFWQYRFKYAKQFAIQLLVFGLLSFVILFRPTANSQQPTAVAGPALETGGTESGTIRKYVWLGALEVFKHYPILGSGPETFAFSYPMFKPVAHNLTSEWDFIYNKAHNEYLNYLANTGVLGFISYTVLIIFTIIQISSRKFPMANQNKNLTINKLGNSLENGNWQLAILSGYISILITNFFGFSVVPVSLLFFLFPAVAIVISDQRLEISSKSEKLNETQMIFTAIVLGTTLYTLFSIHSYWQADINYLQAKTLNRQGNPIKARDLIEKAIKTSKKEPLYWAEASNIDSDIAILSAEEKRDDQTNKFIQLASQESKISTDLSSKNINLKRTQAGIYYKLASFNENYLELAEKTLKDAISITPFDPKLYYQLGILQLKLNKNEEAVKNLEKSVELKTNYKDGRFALGSVYKDLGDKTKAFEQFTYILDNIDPKDDLSKKYLEDLKTSE